MSTNGNNALILDLTGAPLTIVDGKEIKYTKDGRVKQTKNNASVERFVDPIRNKEDIVRILSLLNTKVEETAGKPRFYRAACRDRLLFILGISFGIRVSDLKELQMKHIYTDSSMSELKKSFKVKEEKTEKIRELFITPVVERAIKEYRSAMQDEELKMENYLFQNARVSKVTGKYEPISDDMIGKIVKKITQEAGVEGNFYTHSLRKTFAYQMYMRYTEAGDPLALPKVQRFLNHRNQGDTLRYLGLQRDIDTEDMQNLFDWM